jgi:murein DD-endopeptidase MepM/ murein hydrolase activator NlpD
MDASAKLAQYIKRHKPTIGKVVDYDAAKDKLFSLDFTASNTELDPDTVADTPKFSAWVNQKLDENNARYGIGGYMEHRTLYARSAHFDTDGEPRRLHLGIDIWAEAGTPVYSPLPATIHSYHDNDNFGDYGATIILMNHLVGFPLYSLYGHLSRKSLEGLYVGKPVELNQKIGELGDETENGHWPPHLHYQLMLDIGEARGDYPGVGQFSKKKEWLKNIPDPNLLLKFSV